MLSLAFLLETSIGSASRWYNYFSSLPKGTVGIAVFWGTNGDQDSVEATEWLRGTEAEKVLCPPAGQKLLDRINAYFEDIAKPVLRRLGYSSSPEDFYRAYSIVSSRAFLVDAYHGLSLVPVADAFDHIEDNHVHLQSDYYVCSTCGSLNECEHDDENSDELPTSTCRDVDTCEIIANLPIGPGEEVFNTYDKGLTNAQLLCQYGFTLDVNENNLVTWSVDELINDAAKLERTLAMWRKFVTQWPKHQNWNDSQLVFNPRTRDEDEDGVPTPKQTTLSPLNLNADGQISHQLWLLLFTLVSPDFDVGTKDGIVVARQVAWAQEQLEVCLTTEVTIRDPGPLRVEGREALDLVRKIAESVVQICENKIGSAHCPKISESMIGDLLDAMPAERRLTRRAISYALEERKTVQVCHTAWSEVAELCRKRGSVR